MTLLRTLEETLSQHVSAINARVVVERGRRVLPDPEHVTVEDRARLLFTVRSALRLFTSEERASAIVADIERRLIPGALRIETEHRSYAIQDEDDLRVARAGARELCLVFSGSNLAAQRVATAVSELARNIVAYTPGGRIDLAAHRGPPLRITLCAKDKGSGITDVELVLSGKYRSKTGLGRGLLDVKRLMDKFEIASSPTGTRIDAEVIFP